MPPSGYPPSGYPQQPPAYGQAPPMYGQAPPGYGQAPQGYGQPQPQTWGYPQPMAPARPPRPHGYKHQRRLIASILLLVGAVLLIVAVSTPIWGWTINETNATETFSFYAGSQWKYTCTGSDCPTTSEETCDYGSSGGDCFEAFTNTGSVFGGVDALLIAAIVLAFVAAIFGLMGALAISFHRFQLTLTWLLVLVALALAIAAPMWALGGAPGAVQADLPSGDCSGTSPCNSYFGSGCPSELAGAGATCSWGAGAGWYLALAGAGLLVVGLLLFFITRRDPYTTTEILHAQQSGQLTPSGAVPPAAPYVPTASSATPWAGGAVQPPSTPAYTQPAYVGTPAAAAAPMGATGAAMGGATCPRCGQPAEWVAQYSKYFCRHCNQYV